MACRPHSTSVVSNQSAISDSGMYTESEHSDSEYHRASVAIASLPSDTTTINPQNCIHTTNTSNNQRLQIYHHQNNNINNYYYFFIIIYWNIFYFYILIFFNIVIFFYYKFVYSFIFYLFFWLVL
eukprot:423232_1